MLRSTHTAFPNSIPLIVAKYQAEKRLTWRPVPTPPERVPTYLGYFGYTVVNLESWTELPSLELELEVIKHNECLVGHTWYDIRCLMYDRQGDLRLEWNIIRRLCMLRHFLYDHVKAALGDSYEQHFLAANFAQRGGPPGTSKRLNDWLDALAKLVSSATLSPSLVALTFRFLEAPRPRIGVDYAIGFQSTDIDTNI